MLVTKTKDLNYSLMERKTDEEQGEVKERWKTWWQKTSIKVCFPRKHTGLKQNQKLHGSGTIQTSFKTWKIPLLPLHGRGSDNCHLSEKKKPKGKNLQIADLKQTSSFTISFQFFLKVFHLA